MSAPASLAILYRGPLSSCNYGCPYCPFAKREEGPEELARDRAALERFVAWVAARPGDRRISVLFTPWGEALFRPWYQEALVALSHLEHVDRAAIQTNLSGSLAFVERADRAKLALWATFHPGEVARERFVARCLELDRKGVRFSAGVVGLREHLDAIEALRRELPPHVYVWVNAYKREPGYYRPEERRRLEAVDTHFPTNDRYHPSLGERCRTGETAIAVDGDGDATRCHFVRERIGNIYAPGFFDSLRPRLCPNATCGCHIGYVHLETLGLDRVYGGGILERIPAAPARAPIRA